MVTSVSRPDYELSIIVPMYNVARYIGRCLGSILAQLQADWELIIVDDGSTDESLQIAENLTSSYENVWCIRVHEHTGIGNARNIGLESAQGRYITFVDGDDWVDSNQYHFMLKAAQEFESDIAVCGIVKEYLNNPRQIINEYTKDVALNRSESLALGGVQACYGISHFVTNKLFKTQLLTANKITFNPYARAQDFGFTLLSLFTCSRVSLVANTRYHYFQHTASVTHRFDEGYINDFFNVMHDAQQKLIELNRYSALEAEPYVNASIMRVTEMIALNVEDASRRADLLTLIRNHKKTLLSNREVEK